MSELKSISTSRVEELIAVYGADISKWPADEQQAASLVLEDSEALQVQLGQAAKLDGFLADQKGQGFDLESLSRRIMQQLPEHYPEQPDESRTNTACLSVWFKKLFSGVGWLAPAAVTLIVAISVMNLEFGQLDQAGDDLFDRWAWNDVTGESIEQAPAANTQEFIDWLVIDS